MAAVEWPQLSRLNRLPSLPKEAEAAEPGDRFELRDAAGKIVMLQVRTTDEKGERQFLPFTYWSDRRWRKLEPDALPLWGLDQLKRHAIVILHEGAKAARAMREMVEAATFDQQDKFGAHPWRKELSHAAHLGWIGGAQRPRSTDWSPLKKPGVSVVYIVADNDKAGKRAAEKIARDLEAPGRRVRVVVFDERFPVGFDLADPFPESLFEEQDGKRTYVGPSLTDLFEPVTGEAWIDRLNQQHSVITIGGKTRVLRFVRDETQREAAEFVSFHDFRDFYSNKHVLLKTAKGEEKSTPVGQFWLDSRRAADL